MSPNLEPNGYGTTKTVQAGRPDCRITVGFDKRRGVIPAFLIQLHYQTNSTLDQWTDIARFEHNEAPNQDHNVFSEGLHIDVKLPSRREVKLHPQHSTLPSNAGPVIKKCREYLIANEDLLVDIYEGRRRLCGAPSWPDGGHSAHRLIRLNSQIAGMCCEQSTHDPISGDEPDEILADATETSVEELRAQSEDLEIGPLDDATVVEE